MPVVALPVVHHLLLGVRSLCQSWLVHYPSLFPPVLQVWERTLQEQTIVVWECWVAGSDQVEGRNTAVVDQDHPVQPSSVAPEDHKLLAAADH